MLQVLTTVEGLREPPGGRCLAHQQLRQGEAPRLARVAQPEDPVHQRLHAGQVQSSTAHHRQHHRQTPGRRFSHQRLLVCRQGDVGPVAALALQTACFAEMGIPGPQVRILHLVVIAGEPRQNQHRLRLRLGQLRHELRVAGPAERELGAVGGHLGHAAQGLQRGGGLDRPGLVVPQQPLRGVPQGAQHRQSQALLQRQPARVLEQHRALQRRLQRQLRVPRGALRPGGIRRQDVELTQAKAHAHGVLDSFCEQGVHLGGGVALEEAWAAGHVGARVQGGLHRGRGRGLEVLQRVHVGHGVAVGNHHPVEAPSVPQQAPQQTLVATGGNAVHLVVGTHHPQSLGLRARLPRHTVGLCKVSR
mmetsp:Transcript_93291/g.221853  ORF Transcript_93291/g.221853 Transcript_93291/m.221853 type:complete len:361 (+) Transcript_93291:711-1793(+)